LTEISFTILGKPVPLSRTGHGQFGGKYFSAPTSIQIGLVVDAWQKSGEPRFDDDTPLCLDARFLFERPAGHFGTGRNAGVLKDRFLLTEPTGRPDLDNMVKLICEALQGNAFKDDSRVVTIHAAKRYDERARTVIALRPA
jgi:Holliday junction resolvase RusA-like endonuclease